MNMQHSEVKSGGTSSGPAQLSSLGIDLSRGFTASDEPHPPVFLKNDADLVIEVPIQPG